MDVVTLLHLLHLIFLNSSKGDREMPVIIDTEDGPLTICTVDFGVTARIQNKERGLTWYEVSLGEPIQEKRRSLCSQGAMGIARTLASAGALVRTKELARYIEESLFPRWDSLPVIIENNTPSTPETGMVFEFFMEYISDFAERFDTQEFGIIEPNSEDMTRTVYAYRQTMADFFRKAGIPAEQQLSALKYWKEKGWLQTQPSRPNILTTVKRVGNTTRRVYKIIVPPDDIAVLNEEEWEYVETPSQKNQPNS